MARRSMLALALTTAALTAPTGAGAHDRPDVWTTTGCGFRSYSVAAVTGPNTWTGTMEADLVAYSRRWRHNPVMLTRLRCELFVDGTQVAAADGVTAGPAGFLAPVPITFSRTLTQRPAICTEIDYVDAEGTQGTRRDCEGPNTLQLPPEQWFEWIDSAEALANDVANEADPYVCPHDVPLWDC